MTKQFQVSVGWGHVSGQIFGDPSLPNSKPILALHGFLDNSNSFKPLAPYLTKSGDYYIIAIDLPGMGLSSKVPNGIPYSTKLYLMSIRRVVKHFNLEKFTFLSHSFGCSLAFAYAACYREDVLGLVLIDYAMKDCNIDFKDNIAECWHDGIETYLKAEKDLEEKAKNGKPARELTYDFALARLLESNSQIDESAAKTLLERGLVYNDNKLEYSRDIKLVTGVSMREYHSEFGGIYDSLFTIMTSPVLLIYATPPPYGQKLFDQIMQIMSKIKDSGKTSVELVPLEGTHHFHMLKPAETAPFVLKFLDEKTEIKDTNNNMKA